MKSRTLAALAAVASVLFLSDFVMSKRTGLFPFDLVLGQSVGSLTRNATQSCGQCHLTPVGNVAVTVTPASRSLIVNQSTAVTVSGASSTGLNQGGFTADVTAGSFVASSNTRVNPTGSAITHTISFSRSWTFNLTAPATGGLMEMYTAVNAANGDFTSFGDSWAFHGSSPTNTVSTPVRLFASAAAGVKPTGSSCSDGFGNFSVLGAPLPPTVGNGNFRIEGHGMPPSAPLLLMLSVGGNVAGVDMGFMGAPGCVLRTNLQLLVAAATGGGDASRAEGSLVVPLPIPNDNNLRGLTFAVQFGAIDSNSSRAFPLTVTNGLEITIQ